MKLNKVISDFLNCLLIVFTLVTIGKKIQAGEKSDNVHWKIVEHKLDMHNFTFPVVNVDLILH